MDLEKIAEQLHCTVDLAERQLQALRLTLVEARSTLLTIRRLLRTTLSPCLTGGPQGYERQTD